jgi:uncharacterized membrane protein YdjX (TVP38/TMEM64 family)
MTAGSSAEPNRVRTLSLAIALASAAAVGIFAFRSDVAVPRDADGVRQLFASVVPHRTAWYALPVVAVAYVVLGLALVPVLLLVAVTGLVFGPWLGPVYAAAGCLASASAGFAIGRWAGYRRIQKIGGRRVADLHDALERNGTLAVFVMRKVPAPFMISNIVAGASRVRYRDFLIGTILGMGAFVVALAAFGYQVSQAISHPSWTSALVAAVFLGVPLTLAWFINHALKRRAGGERGRARA